MTMNRLLLCTDLDRTLLPNGSEPESPGARQSFARLAADPAVRTVYVTGRDFDLVDEAIRSWVIPVPDLLIADVGSTVAEPKGGRWERWTDWDERLAADWSELAAPDVVALVGEATDLRLQDPSRQKKFKCSWFTPGGRAGLRLADEARARLADGGLRANVIWSEDERTGQGLLDVLPSVATKLLALEFVIERWGYRTDQVVFAGDSGNDLEVLASPIPAVLVANATDEVRAEALGLAHVAGHPEALYCARGGYLGMNGNYSAGILEGLHHYYPDWAERVLGGE